jgi:Polyketide cyclase / dehydrase and lipid transport
MARYRTMVPSSKGAHALFAYMADFTHSEQWDPGVLSSRRLDEGPLALGARFLVVAGFLGRRVPLEYEITAYEPDSLVQVTARTNWLHSVDTMTFESSDAGSTLSYDAELNLLGAYRVLGPLLDLGFRRVGDRAREGLRREIR